MTNKSNVLFIYTGLSSFVKNDLELITKYFKVCQHHYVQSKSLFGQTKSLLKELYFLINNVSRTQFIFIWFSDYHSLLPVLFGKLFKKRVFLVAGGYDVAYIPELNYGAFKNPIRAFCAKYSFKNATVVLAVSKYIESEVINICNDANTKIVYNGIRLENNLELDKKRQNIVLTVGKIDTNQRFRLKGIEFFVKLANEFPQYKFVIIGIKKNLATLINPIHSNVETYDFLEYDELIRFYKTSKVYCQFSVVESFGLAMLEAMYFGCNPIANDVGALAEVVSENGTIITPFDLLEAKRAVKNNIENFYYDKETSEAVSNKFSLQEREKKLTELFHNYNLIEK